MSSTPHSSFSFDPVVDLSSSLRKPSRVKYRFHTSDTSCTPRTPAKNTSTDKPCSIVAVSEGRGCLKGTVGLAIMDLRQADIELNEFIDSSTFSRLKTKLLIADPVEIIVAENFNEKTANAVMAEMIRSSLPNTTVTTVHRRFFNHQRGAELVTQLANAEISNCDNVVLQKQFCMQSCSALIKYVEYIQNIVFASKTLHFSYRDIEKMCLLDVASWKNLEIDNNLPRKERKSLLAIVDETQTSGGARLLRSNLLQPSGDLTIIDQRLDAVEELVDNPHLVEKLRQVLGSTSDLGNLFNVFIESSREATVQRADFNLTQLLRLKQVLLIVRPLRQLMKNFKCFLLKRKSELLADERIDKICEILYSQFQDEAIFSHKKSSLNVRHRKCYAIKEGISVNLDVARRAYEELLRDIQNQEEELHKHLPERNTRLAYSASRGFHYVWVCGNPSTATLPPIFINVTRNRSSVTFSSRNLLRYNDRIEQSISEVMIATDIVVQNAIKEIRPLIAVLYHVIDFIATIDMLCSFAVYASNRNTVRPRFGDSIIINEGKHPLLDYSIGDKVVPNDTYLTTDSRTAIITGPNMTGKSTYLKQVCQLCILAQSGCFVPAKIAILPVFLRISSRIGHNDNLTKNLSAFAVEMDEITLILQYSDDRTLLVIDELARSTSAEEGIGICYAIIEKLIKQKAYTIFATHFLDLAALDVSYSAVENFHFASQVAYVNGQEQLSPTHKLHRGSYNGPLYGFELVELSTFPEEVIESARRLAQFLYEESAGKRAMSADTMFHHALARNAHRLRQIVASRNVASEECLKKCLSDIRRHLQVNLSKAIDAVTDES
ncbi:MutS protein him-14 [Trichostrongylus colubriformis]|uniref:MutS protein him-14 n=1 Tax=Trichostrongylus colubriformis TaxID=6319 RepID=A0AAN8J2I6_TRICO